MIPSPMDPAWEARLRDPNNPPGKEVLDRYPRSGVYDAKTDELLWEIQEEGYEKNFLFSSEFESWVWIQPYAPWSKLDLTLPALRFYHQDHLQREWAFSDILRSPATSYFYPWEGYWLKSASINGSQLHLTTYAREMRFDGNRFPLGGGESHRFDLNTGRLLHSETENSLVWVYPVSLGLFVLMCIGSWRLLRSRKS